MGQVLLDIQETKNLRDICKAYGLNLGLLKEFFRLQARGYNNTDIAKKMAIHRITIQRYVRSLKKMKEGEFKFLYGHITGGENEKDNQSEER